MKKKILELVESGSFGKNYNSVFDYFIATLIILNIAAIAIESLSDIGSDFLKILKVFEVISLVIFTIEYLLRIYVADLVFPRDKRLSSIIRFIVSPLGLIDLLAILPFYIPFIIPFDLMFLRVFRLFRFVRVFKIARYNKAINLIASVIKEKRQELSMTFFTAIIVLIAASFLMYFIEGKVQPDKFQNVFSAMWWAVATLTTIGYGDIYPITTAGKLLSGCIAVLGIGLIALPAGIISAGFIEKIHKSQPEEKLSVCPHCGKALDHS
jgi:voltage-gated potassium channel